MPQEGHEREEQLAKIGRMSDVFALAGSYRQGRNRPTMEAKMTRVAAIPTAAIAPLSLLVLALVLLVVGG